MIDFENTKFGKLVLTESESVIAKASEMIGAKEEIISAYKSSRNFVFFTDKRIVALKKQGLFGKKRDYTSLPYGSIQIFSCSTSGGFERNGALELRLHGIEGTVRFEFSGSSDLVEIAQLISSFAIK